MTWFSKTPEASPLSDFVSRTRLAPRQAHKALTLWPLQLRDAGPGPDAPAYISLGQALAQGTLTLGEVDAGGSVPHVRAENRGGLAVLFVFGEEIRGAKQNRVANASFLVAPKSTTVLDVSCVEAGRWASRSARFAGTDEVLSHALRRKMARKVAFARSRGAGFEADQGEVWDEIGCRLEHSGAASDSQAYADYRQSRTSDLEEIAQAFHPVEGQVGFVACMADRVVGIEAIGRPEVFRADFPALLRSYAIDAVDAALVSRLERGKAPGAHFDSPEAFLDALARAPFASGPSLGLGEDLRLEGKAVAGCALVHGGLVHLTAFPEN